MLMCLLSTKQCFCAGVVLSLKTLSLPSTKYKMGHVKILSIHHHVKNQRAENSGKTPVHTLKYDGDH